MILIVKSRDLKWRGVRLPKGASFEAETAREIAEAALLIKVHKAAEMPSKPLRKAAAPRPPKAETPPPAAPTPQPSLASPEPRPGRYFNRRLKTDD